MMVHGRGSEPQRLLPRTLEDRIIELLARSTGALICMASVLAWISLLTWSINDPSLTNATGGSTRNLIGPLGAVLSDLMLQTLGFAAVFMLLPPAIWGIELMFAGRTPDFRFKLCLYPVAVLALAAGCAALPTVSSWPIQRGYGGLVGDLLFGVTNSMFGTINPERSSLASGLVFFGGGIAGLINSLGMSGRDLTFLMKREPGETRLITALWNRVPKWGGLKETRNHTAMADTARNVLYDRNPVSTLHAVYARQPASYPTLHSDHGYQADLPTDNLGHSGPREQQAYAAAAFAGHHGTSRYAGHLRQQTPPFYQSAQQTVPTHVPSMPMASMSPLSVRREAGFDNRTDEASREIAERFAPLQATAESSTGKASGLLSTMWRSRGAATYKRPSLNLLKRASQAKPGPEFTSAVLRGTARLLEDVLADFGIKGEVKDIKPGPVVTLFELEPARGTKASRVISLADDIARSMSVTAARVAIVSGRNVIGIELPNVRRETVFLREIFEADSFKATDATLPLALGRTIGGDPVVTDLARMPHLLVAGTTGSGKSVGVNAMILSLIYKLSPDDCRFLMIDPKMLELSIYNGIPHLLTPVVTDPHKAVVALNWAVSEMEERYKRMSHLAVRNIDVYNNRVRNAQKRGEVLGRTVQTGIDSATGQPIFEQDRLDAAPMPYIVIVVDEFADLMAVAGKEIEFAVQRLAQMARAAGIHLIMATQRPSVDIITGTIKANFPTRISFKVASRIDSRTIINEQGAEQLLGQGDMLVSGGANQLTRVHGPFVSDEEVEAIVASLRAEGPPRYIEGITDELTQSTSADNARAGAGCEDDLYDRAVAVVLRDRKASTSYIQRRLSIGYNRAADLIERMEHDGLVSAASATGKRDILVGGGPVSEVA